MGILAIGVMSGTSCDGVSAALAQFSNRTVRILTERTTPYSPRLARLLHKSAALSAAELSALNMALGEAFARAARRCAAAVPGAARRIAVIGSHGHTVYHGPSDPIPSTLQLGEPSVIAQRTGLPVVANFRPRDIAAGGSGAPLVPYFDAAFFGRGAPRALQNIGGIANVSIVGRGIRPMAFDTGPGNCWMDVLAQRISRGRLRYDRGGRLARLGRIDEGLAKRLWQHPYFRRPPPKSTGRELFNERLLRDIFGSRLSRAPHAVLSTVTYFTAYSIVESYHRFAPYRLREIIVSGGGVYNRTLMDHLTRLAAPAPVRSIADYGIPPQAKEPAAFAYLALRALQGRVNHLPSTTGAKTACILGSLTLSFHDPRSTIRHSSHALD
ncbi:MAG: anhydro-N-acetylmuramic acid kinase [Candidatus Omnitrophica bacterium]|nr:anhydro-N-acetylmuramic acid kinase [Candidatus Omnitrophota bacterium]